MNQILKLLISSFSLMFVAISSSCSLISSTAYTTQNHKSEAILKLGFKLYLPKGYDPHSKKKWPLLLFLHGAGERGSDLSLVELHGPPKLIKQKKFKASFIVLAPQCPKNVWWPVMDKAVYQLLQQIKTSYKVDHSRIYLTGLSMGGFGSWSLASKYPLEFAAVAPVCGGGEIQTACKIKNTPMWAFHGAKDTVIPMQRSIEMIDAVRQCGNKQTRLTIYPNATHNSWTKTYANPNLYDWFLSHSK